MKMFYLDNEMRLKEITDGKEGDVLTWINGIPKFMPLPGTKPPEPKLTVSAGGDQQTTVRTSISLAAKANLPGATFSWKVIKQPDTYNPVTTVVLSAPASGDLVVDANKYAPGTLILLQGIFKSLWFNNIKGTQEKPIIIQNKGFVAIGNPTWSGIGSSTGLRFANCHHFKVIATEPGAILVTGSTVTALSPAKEQWRAHYRNIDMTELTDNFELDGITSSDGGHGIVAKTDPVKGNPYTYDNSSLGGMVFRNMTFRNNWNEGMYIGHTATLWNVTLNKPEYPTDGKNPDPVNLKEPLQISYVNIGQCIVSGAGLDGIQVDGAYDVEISLNEVVNWATQKDLNHQGGIIIGSKVDASTTNNNWIHDSWGQPIQFYAKGGGDNDHYIGHNWLEKGQGDMLSIRGINGAYVRVDKNVILQAGLTGNLIRVNGYLNGNVKQAIITNNILAGPLNNGKGGTIYPKNFIYTENGPVNMVEEKDNQKYNKVTDIPSMLDMNAASIVGPKANIANFVIKSPANDFTEVQMFTPGEYIFEVTATYQDQIAVDTVSVIVK